ncbi:hypothetical protein OZD69_06950 [Wolbachia endosymbiont of Drosophila chauvacae]|jgi:uncharacterized membrane protein YsdA (DUF1294 family)|nr:hypothetical protein [Wolbachia endosymbiont of Drosophila chauvacae]
MPDTPDSPDLTFGEGPGTPAATAPVSTAEEGKRGARILASVGAVLTVISLIVMLTAGSDATIGWRRSEFSTWILLAPSLVGLFGGLYGMVSARAYEEKNAYRSFLTASVVITVAVVVMAVKAYS